jgi:hypothetical protein
MPVYNAARFVEAAIRSVLAQTFDDFELVVIDDGSSDHSARIVQSFDDQRIRFVQNERNRGLTPTLNRGLALARGEFVARQDADDLSEPARLERQVAFLDANPEVAVVGSWYTKIGEHGQPLGKRTPPTDDVSVQWAMLSYCPIVHSATTFRRDVIETLGGYDGRFAYAQDFDLWSRVAKRYRLANVPEYLVQYRVVSTSLTATIGDSSGEGARTSLANVRSLLDAVGESAPTPSQHAEFCSLMFGESLALSSSDLAAVFERAVHLLDVFTAPTRIGAQDATRLRADVELALRKRFLDNVETFTADDFERVGRLLYGDASWLRLVRTRPVRSAIAAARAARLGDLFGRRTDPA